MHTNRYSSKSQAHTHSITSVFVCLRMSLSLSLSFPSFFVSEICMSIHISIYHSFKLLIYPTFRSFMSMRHNALVIYHHFPFKKKKRSLERFESQILFSNPLTLAHCGILRARILHHHKQSSYHWWISR